MRARFRAKKEKVLLQLSKPDEEYTDASPKGSVDDDIRELIQKINEVDGFITLSSCAGRIAVFLDGPPKQESATTAPVEDDDAQATSATVAASASTGGKGGGRWLFTSHDPLDLERFSKDGAVFQRFGMPSDGPLSFPPAESRPQYVHFKFEPMLLALMASTHEQAQNALSAAMSAGFRESGIGSLYDSKYRPTPPMVTVRSSGLALDCVIGYKLPDSPITPMVTEAYLRSMIKLANDRFEMNETRKLRFRQAFIQKAGLPNSFNVRPTGGYVSRTAEYERRRTAETRRKHDALLIGGALDGASTNGGDQHDFDDDDEYGFDMLTSEGENGERGRQEKARNVSDHIEQVSDS